MLIKQVSVHGLRGYSEKATLKLAQPNGTPGSGLTIIVGPNNSGKSTLIEVFRMRRRWGGPPSFNVGMRNRATDSVEISIDFFDHIEIIRSIRPGSSETNVENFDHEKTPVYYVPSRRYFSPSFNRATPSSRNSFVETYNSQTEDRSPRIQKFEDRLAHIERNQADFNEALKKVIPDLLEWSVDQHETGQYFLRFSSDKKNHSSEGAGEGIISAFVIVASLFDSLPNDVIVIDEPELSLHPQIQKRLSKFLEDYSGDRQIIISTHSPYFITRRGIEGGLKICRCWDRNGSIEIYSAASSEKSSALWRLARRNINNPHAFGLDAREIFFLEDGVLVFEGQEDVVLWPDIAEKLGQVEYQTYGWGAGGAENIRNVLDLLQCLGFKKVVAIFDGDKVAESRLISDAFPTYDVHVLPMDDIRTKKAAIARQEKPGILDDKYSIRPDMIEPMKDIFENIERYMSADN